MRIFRGLHSLKALKGPPSAVKTQISLASARTRITQNFGFLWCRFWETPGEPMSSLSWPLKPRQTSAPPLLPEAVRRQRSQPRAVTPGPPLPALLISALQPSPPEVPTTLSHTMYPLGWSEMDLSQPTWHNGHCTPRVNSTHATSAVQPRRLILSPHRPGNTVGGMAKQSSYSFSPRSCNLRAASGFRGLVEAGSHPGADFLLLF